MLCESGGLLAKKKKRSSVEKNNRIEEATRQLQQGSITVATFLSRMVYEKNEICFNMVPKLDIFKEESSDEEPTDEELTLESSNNNNECVVCKDKPSNIVLLPCKHLKICDECNLKLQADALSRGVQNYSCPYCRENVNDIMQVYT